MEPGIDLLGETVRSLWMLGYPDQARWRSEENLALAPVQSPALRAWRSPPHRLVSGKHFLTPEAVPGAFVVPLRRGIEIARPRRQVLANHVFV